ncbi:hypothetical protein PTKIN_Ptkin12aG0115200 [Pterospermum kingtungense]
MRVLKILILLMKSAKEVQSKGERYLELSTIDCQNDGNESGPAKRDDTGKGLMTVWRVVNPKGGDIPIGVDFSSRQIVPPPQTSSSAWRKQPPQSKRRQPLVSLTDSLLLGKIHVALLKLLLSDVEAELISALLPEFSLSCKFLAFLHSVENQEFVVDFWKKSLIPLTWTEILHQV